MNRVRKMEDYQLGKVGKDADESRPISSETHPRKRTSEDQGLQPLSIYSTPSPTTARERGCQTREGDARKGNGLCPRTTKRRITLWREAALGGLWRCGAGGQAGGVGAGKRGRAEDRRPEEAESPTTVR